VTAGVGPVLQFAAFLPYLIALLAIIVMAVMFISVRYVREAKANAGLGTSAPDLASAVAFERLPLRKLPESIKLASAYLRRLVTGGAGTYEVPWVIAVGAGSADLDRLLPDQLPWPPDLAGAHRTLLSHAGQISFCRTGVVLGFEDGLLNGADWRRRWNALVRAMQACRPDRPVDGLVVVIDASELGSATDWQDRLVARGDQIYHLIWSVQRITGWRIPVYLLVRGCEELSGFADWVLALPRQARRQLLGWSVPYAIDSVFEPKWVDEGIAEVGQHLSIGQLLLMMPEPEVGVAEGLLLFPGEVQRLAAPLSVLLTSMLRTSAYHEAFMFRGFFLAGRVPGAGAQEPQFDAFAEAVFSRKVFPEHKLAQPAYGEATRRHRQIRIAQVGLAGILVLCIIGILYIGVKSDYFPPVLELLRLIDAKISSDVSAEAGLAPAERVKGVALGLLKRMSDIEIDRIDTIAAPTSLLTSANAQVQKAIARAYDVAVLQAAYQALTDKRDLDARLKPAPLPGATSLEALSTTVDKIIDYDKHIQVYHKITNPPRIPDLAELMSYALSVPLPPGFEKNYALYWNALRMASKHPIQAADVQPKIEKILQDRYEAVINDSFTRSDLVNAVAKLYTLAGNLATASSQDIGRGLLTDTRTTLDTISRLLLRPSYDWLRNTPAGTSPLQPLDKLKGLEVVRPELIDGLIAAAGKAQADTRNWLLHATAFDSTPVLAASNGAVTLSPPMVASHRLLDDLFLQRFMQPVSATGTSATLAPGTRINWDIQTLLKAQDLAESYLAFVPKEGEAVPQSIQHQIRSVAGAEAARNVAVLVALAARPASDLPNGGSRAVLQEVSALANALPLLTNLRNTLRQAGATAQAATLDTQVSQQAVRLLRQIDNDLASAAPYQLADPRLSFWRGSPPLAEPAFGANSPTELASTLPPRRDFVESLASEYAAPLVGYLHDPGTSKNAAAAGLLARWQSILDTLDRYHRSDPSNSLTRLEQFITVDMDKIDLSNCRQLNIGGSAAADYFAEQLQSIRRAVAGRCGSVVHVDTTDRYTSLATTFNAKLAGRFPFAPLAGPDTNGAGPALGEADPNEVRRFLLDYGQDLPVLEAQFQSGGSYGESGRAAEVFLSQLEGIRTAFAPMLADPTGNAPLSYQVDVQFFTNPTAGSGQNQVLDAAVSTGNQRASSLGGTSRIVWITGQPLRVELRWAANAPMIPDATAHPWPRISGLMAQFDFSGTWSLLHLIMAQAPGRADLNALQDRSPQVVAFDVPLKRNPNAATGGNTDLASARVYMRLALTGVSRAPGQPEKPAAIVVPEFPTAAPLLGRSMSYLGPPVAAAPVSVAPSTTRSAPQ
jgi:type VI secretion system protein ImpL